MTNCKHENIIAKETISLHGSIDPDQEKTVLLKTGEGLGITGIHCADCGKEFDDYKIDIV